ncbi:BRO-N domain-containing protein [Streptosporangium sp. CA-135522]|uniref:BRO-N domain-containing protein n=1 Tax=Streptosporangium sp. CA-135522 TaxID=3240072 RepID=UPI003D9025D3
MRVVLRDGEPWWVAKDICDVLGIQNVSNAMLKLDEDEKQQVRANIGQTDVMRGRAPWFVSESGLYSLILRRSTPP